VDGVGAPLPVGIERIAVHASSATSGSCHARVSELPDGAWRADVTLWDDAGALLVRVTGLRLERAPESAVTAAASAGSLRSALLAISDPALRAARLEELLRTQLAAVLGAEVARLDAATQLRGLGLDSLMALEVRKRIERALGVRLSAQLLLSSGTLAELTAHLVAAWERASAGSPDGPGEHGNPHMEIVR